VHTLVDTVTHSDVCCHCSSRHCSENVISALAGVDAGGTNIAMLFQSDQPCTGPKACCTNIAVISQANRKYRAHLLHVLHNLWHTWGSGK